MSLEAKIEAVIYASEEPVTLAQLMGLLGGEAQAELDELESRQQSLALDVEPGASDQEDDQDALNAETLGEAEPAPDTEAATSEPETDPSEEGTAEGAQDEVAEPASENNAAESSGAAGDAASEAAAPDEEALKREAAQEAKACERKLRDYFRSLLDHLIAEYARDDRGLEIREVAGGFRLATKPEYHDAVRGFARSLKPPLKLSLQALETLAVVAYKQPVTAPEIAEIRGVDSGGVLGGLLTRKLISTAGRKQVIGRPILYKTTKEFLLRFGLKDINELPSIEEFEKMAGELVDAEPVQEEILMESPPSNRSEEDADIQSAAVDEINAAPEPTNVFHDDVEDMMSDKSYSPEGAKTEPADPHDVEPMRNVHQAQADGDSTEIESGTDNPADDIVVDGRLSGLPPGKAEGSDNPSAQEAEVQAKGEGA